MSRYWVNLKKAFETLSDRITLSHYLTTNHNAITMIGKNSTTVAEKDYEVKFL